MHCSKRKDKTDVQHFSVDHCRGYCGWLASLVVEGTGLGIVGDIIVGILGAFIGAFLLTLLLPGSFAFTGI